MLRILNRGQPRAIARALVKPIHETVVCYASTQRVNTKAKLVNKIKGQIIHVRPGMTIKELASSMGKPVQHIYDCLEQIKYAQSANMHEKRAINNLDVIAKIVKLSGFRYQTGAQEEVNFDEIEAELMKRNETRNTRPKPKPGDLVRRHPVVTIMGHVDHGKTTLLDSLRGTNVVASEFGGITQHIGAFNCTLDDASKKGDKSRSITFLDTPGHAVFSNMRSRGAKVTDIVVLVIAAEDGVMAQTVESIEFAKSSKCPIIVAINKIDKVSAAQIENVKKELLKHELISEEFGGDVQVVPISALKKTNLERLKEEIWTRAEIMELKGDPKGLVEGYIIESSQDPHRGKLATVLVQRGTLQKSQYLVAGMSWCRVKSIHDEKSKSLDKAGLSQAVQVMGWKELPNAGDEVLQVASEHEAKELVEVREKLEKLKRERQDFEFIQEKRKLHDQFYRAKLRERLVSGKSNRVTFDDLYGAEIVGISSKEHETNEAKSLNLIVKADVDGSLEAILNVLETYPLDSNVKINLVHFEVGPLKKSDLELAQTFDALIYCFNLAPNPAIENSIAPQSDSSKPGDNQTSRKLIRHFNIVYKLFDDIKIELNIRAPLVEQEEKIGEAEVLKVFDYEESNRKTLQIAGGRCMDGLLEKKSLFRIIRNGVVVYDRQTCGSLKHLKNDVNTIKRNVEFGMSFENEEVQVKPGDRIQCYSIKMVKKPIEWDLGF